MLELWFGTSLTYLILAFLSFIAISISVGVVETIIVERKKPPRSQLAKALMRVLFVSEFGCKSCGRSFLVYEERERVPYCQECGFPDPEHIITLELREELKFRKIKADRKY